MLVHLINDLPTCRIYAKYRNLEFELDGYRSGKRIIGELEFLMFNNNRLGGMGRKETASNGSGMIQSILSIYCETKKKTGSIHCIRPPTANI